MLAKLVQQYQLKIFFSNRYLHASILNKLTNKAVASCATNSDKLIQALGLHKPKNDVNACRLVGKLLADSAKRQNVCPFRFCTCGSCSSAPAESQQASLPVERSVTGLADILGRRSISENATEGPPREGGGLVANSSQQWRAALSQGGPGAELGSTSCPSIQCFLLLWGTVSDSKADALLSDVRETLHQASRPFCLRKLSFQFQMKGITAHRAQRHPTAQTRLLYAMRAQILTMNVSGKRCQRHQRVSCGSCLNSGNRCGSSHPNVLPCGGRPRRPHAWCEPICTKARLLTKESPVYDVIAC